MNSTPKIVAILAGGKATRFGGQDKGEILIGGQRLIDIIYERLMPQATDVIISGPHNYGLDMDVVPDNHDAPGGPVGGIYSIYKTLESNNIEGFFTVAVDGPNLPSDLSLKLYSAETSTIASDLQGRHPTYGWWRMKDLSLAWSALKGKPSQSLNSLANTINAKPVSWAGVDSFVNINDRDDLKSYEELSISGAQRY